MADQIYSGLLLIGAVQGIVLGVILFVGASPRRSANRFLAVLLFFLAYRLAAELLHFHGFAGVDSILYHVVLDYNWIFGCLLFFYVCSYLDESFHLSRAHAFHFVPVAVEFVVSNFVKSQNFYWDGTRESLGTIGYWAYVVWMHTPLNIVVSCALIVVYSWLSIRRIDSVLLYPKAKTPPSDQKTPAKRATSVIGQRPLSSPNTTSQAQTTWLRRILRLYIIYAVLATVASLVDFVFFDFAFHPTYYYLTYGGLALITYWMALQGYTHRNDPAIQRSILTNQDQDQTAVRLRSIIEQSMAEKHLYREPDCSLASLAKALGEKPYLLTQVLNQTMNVSFSDFVNGHRVADVTRRLADPQFANYTLLAIANDAGFNSKASFNRVVKKFTGRSPSQLRADILREEGLMSPNPEE